MPSQQENKKLVFWGITTYFNPANYSNKYENYKIFRQKSKEQGLNLITVELSFNDQFELKKEDAEILIQIKGNENNIMWQKEALLNIGLKNLPKECEYIAWLDCDIVFDNDNWVSETINLLKKYQIIQPFSLCVRLNKNQTYKNLDISKIIFGGSNNQKQHSFTYKYLKYKKNNGYPGFVWASRKDVFKDIGFYDKTIMGSGDVVFVDSFFSLYDNFTKFYYSQFLKYDVLEYQKKLSLITDKKVFYCQGKIFHLWHGEIKNRMYEYRPGILEKNNFDTERDIRKNSFGIWEWTGTNKKIEKAVKQYFFLREEIRKNNFLLEHYLFIFKYFLNIKNTYLVLLKYIDIIVGKIGQLIKKISPLLYKKILKIKKLNFINFINKKP